MDRGAWSAIVHRVAGVRHNCVTNTFTTFSTIYRDIDSEKQKVDLGSMGWDGMEMII